MANSTIGTVSVILSAKDQNLASSFQKAGNNVKSFRDQVAAAGKIVAGFFALNTAMNVVNSFQQATNAAKEYAQAGKEIVDALDRQAQNLGITSRAMAAFSVMEQRADLAAGSLAAALSKMQQSIQDSIEYGSKADKTFERLGLRFSDLVGLNADDQFKKISDAIAGVQTASERTSLSVEIFGRSGKELISTISQGSAGFIEAAKAAKSYGLAMEEVNKNAVLAVDDKQKELEIYKQGLQASVAASNAIDEQANLAFEKLFAEQQARDAATLNKYRHATNELGAWMAKNWFGNNAPEQAMLDAAAVAKISLMRAQAEARKQSSQGAVEAKKAADDMTVAYVQSGAEMLRSAQMRAQVMKQDVEQQKETAKESLNAVNAILASERAVADVRATMDAASKKNKADQIQQMQGDFNSPRGQWNSDIKAADELRSKDATEDPRVKYEIEVGNLMAEFHGQMTDAQVRAEAERRVALEERWKNPEVDPQVVYNEKVAELLRINHERNAQAELQRQETQHAAQLSAYSDIAGNIATITEDAAKHSIQAFYINKAAQLAQASVNAWMAYSNTMATTSPLASTPGLQQALAATSLAAGMVAVANIANTQPPGRAAGGAVSRGGLYEVNERGPEVLSIGDKSFLMMGGKNGKVTPNSGGGGPGGVTVNVHNAPGTTARVERSGTDDAPNIEVIIERVDQAIAGGIRAGTGASSRAMQTTFGLNRSRGGT